MANLPSLPERRNDVFSIFYYETATGSKFTASIQNGYTPLLITSTFFDPKQHLQERSNSMIFVELRDVRDELVLVLGDVNQTSLPEWIVLLTLR